MILYRLRMTSLTLRVNVMTLREYIVAQGWLALPASEVHRRMNETIVGQPNEQRYTFSGTADLIGAADNEDLKNTLAASGLTWVVEQLGGDGLPLSDARVQAVLLAFEQAGKAWAKTLRLKGIPAFTRYETYVAPGECTLQMIEEVLG